MEPRTPSASLKACGWSMLAFALFILTGTIVKAILADSLTVDLLSVLVVWLSIRVLGGSLRAAKVARWIFVVYVVICVAIMICIFAAPERIKVYERPLSEASLPWVIGLAAIVATWATINFLLLWRAIREAAKPAPEAQP